MAQFRTIRMPASSGNRPLPHAECYCIICHRALKAGQPHRWVHLVDGGWNILHPDDEEAYGVGDPGDMGGHRVGMDCARKLGLEWTQP